MYQVLLLVQQRILYVWSADAGFATAPHQAQSLFGLAANGLFLLVQAFAMGLQQSVSNLVTCLLTRLCVFLPCLSSLSGPSMSEIRQGDNPTHYATISGSSPNVAWLFLQR